MRAVVCREIGSLDHLVVEDQPLPSPGPGEVRVSIAAAGVTFVDALIATGRYQFPIRPPYTPGGESAGTIDAVGDGVRGWACGDRVLVSAGTTTGGFAESVLARTDHLTALPSSIDFLRGATFRQVYCTAWFALTRRVTLRPGETVLVTGAGGGVGLAAVDVARSLGARVLAVASSDEKRAAAIAAGADVAIDPATEDVKTRARELTDGEGVDVVYDVTGGATAEAALRALAFDGRYCVIGFPGGIPRIPLNLVLLNNRSVVGVEWGGWLRRFPEENAALVQEVVDAIAAGHLHPVIPTVRPLDQAASALEDLLERRVVGKLALVP